MKLEHKSNAELLALREAIESNPLNRNTSGSIYKYNAATRQKLNKLDYAITHNLRLAKIARGETIDDSGYSGRQSNRR